MHGSSRRFLLTSTVYIGAFLLLLCLAVFAGSFSRTVGDAHVFGRFSPLPLFNRSSLETLTLSWNGLDLEFSRRSVSGALRFDSDEAAADIVLSGNERLRVSPGVEPGSTLAIAEVNADASPDRRISIPFRVSGLDESASSTLSWRQGGRSFRLSLPSGASVDYDAREISLELGKQPMASGLRFEALSPESFPVRAGAPAVAPIPAEKSLPSAEQLASALAKFADLAYTGWTSQRVSTDGGWRLADGSSGLTEEIGVGLLAEALERGTFPDRLEAWRRALEARPAKPSPPLLPSATCVYTGRVQDFARQAQERDAAETARLKTLASQGDASLLAQPGVLVTLLDRGGAALARLGIASLRAQDPAKLSAASTLTLLEALEDDAQLVGDDQSVAAAATQLIDSRVLPSLAATSDGAVFFRSEAGIDVKQSLRCGSLLLRAGTLFQSSRIDALGRSLIVSALSLAGDAGVLPASVGVSSGRIVSRDGALAPESVYAILPLDRHVPREVPLFRVLGSGCWMWTAANLVSADQADDVVRLVLSYPPGIAHNIVFRGLRPFSQITMHGIPWHADPSYAKYSDGWSYDGADRTLFMKLTGKRAKEEVDLTF